MARLADGDRSAFEPAYAALWPVVRSFCRRLLGDDDAEDAAQLALMKVFDRASSYDPGRDALTWVLALASWECRTVRRRRSRAAETDLGAVEEIAAFAGKTPESCAINAQLEAALVAVLGTLEDSDRETLRMTLLEDGPTTLSPATFRKRRQRALEKLREAWRRMHGP